MSKDNNNLTILSGQSVLLPSQNEIQRRIYSIRGVQVMLDRDLAQLYQVETKVLNQAVKRNMKRFPDYYMFLEDGSNLPAYMDLGIERADKVLIIGTPKYQEKCYEPSSGVAFEDCIIRAGISRNIGTKKFIACLREGNFKISFPIYIGIKKGHDFTAEENYDKELESLCRDIYGRPIIQRPVLGDIPDYAK